MACSQLRKAFKIIYLYVFILVLKINNTGIRRLFLARITKLISDRTRTRREVAWHALQSLRLFFFSHVRWVVINDFPGQWSWERCVPSLFPSTWYGSACDRTGYVSPPAGDGHEDLIQESSLGLIINHIYNNILYCYRFLLFSECFPELHPFTHSPSYFFLCTMRSKPS